MSQRSTPSNSRRNKRTCVDPSERRPTTAATTTTALPVSEPRPKSEFNAAEIALQQKCIELLPALDVQQSVLPQAKKFVTLIRELLKKRESLTKFFDSSFFPKPVKLKPFIRISSSLAETNAFDSIKNYEGLLQAKYATGMKKIMKDVAEMEYEEAQLQLVQFLRAFSIKLAKCHNLMQRSSSGVDLSEFIDSIAFHALEYTMRPPVTGTTLSTGSNNTNNVQQQQPTSFTTGSGTPINPGTSTAAQSTNASAVVPIDNAARIQAANEQSAAAVVAQQQNILNATQAASQRQPAASRPGHVQNPYTRTSTTATANVTPNGVVTASATVNGDATVTVPGPASDTNNATQGSDEGDPHGFNDPEFNRALAELPLAPEDPLKDLSFGFTGDLRAIFNAGSSHVLSLQHIAGGDINRLHTLERCKNHTVCLLKQTIGHAVTAFKKFKAKSNEATAINAAFLEEQLDEAAEAIQVELDSEMEDAAANTTVNAAMRSLINAEIRKGVNAAIKNASRGANQTGASLKKKSPKKRNPSAADNVGDSSNDRRGKGKQKRGNKNKKTGKRRNNA